MLRGISDGAEHLAKGDTGRFMNAVSLRLNPPRSGGGKAAPKEAKVPKAQQEKAEPPEAVEDDNRSALQRLVDRFR
jgi:PTH1 family peptidyl-tRNA hydrolase